MWLPVLFLAVMASGSACPDSCQCRSPVVECRAAAPDLAQLDQLSLAGFDELELHELGDKEVCRLTRAVSRSAFLRRLKRIEVTNCSALTDANCLKWDATSTPRSSAVLPNVRLINVSHNMLTDVPWNVYTDNKVCDQIRVFDAGHNRIGSIAAMNSKYMPQLTWLSLASNNLDYISAVNFRYFEYLEYLDVSDNVLYTLEGIFDSLRSLQRLNVAGNKLEHVQAHWFQNLSKLVELDISRNKLTFIPADTLQPLASLSVFRLAENPLIERDLSLLLGTGRRLETVDASRIGLARVPAALTRSVRTLKLAGNQLTSINSGDLDSYPLLRVLDLSDNRLMIIEDDALGRLDGLEELILSGNILPTIPKSLPNGLKIFDLRQNAIAKLTVNDLQGLYLLKELNLSGNVISSIEGGSFRQLPALETLDISDNPIKKLPSDTLSGPSNLVTLRMSGLMALKTEENQNQDTAFPILTPERLVTLDVSRSPALAAQLLADNAALSACKSLQELDLSYTNISAMRSDLAYVLPQLRKLNLIGNEWNCSADQFWLGEWIRQHEASIQFSTRCKTPIDLEGKLLEEMPGLPSTQVTTTKVAEEETTKVTLKTTELANSTTVPPIAKGDVSKILQQLNNRIETSSTSKIDNEMSHTTLSTTKAQKVINTTPQRSHTVSNVISTTLKPALTTQFFIMTQGSTVKNTMTVNKSSILPSINHELEEPIAMTKKEKLPNLSTTSRPQEYVSKIVHYKSTPFSTQSSPSIHVIKNNQDIKPLSTTSNIDADFLTTNSNEKVTNDTPSTTITSSDTEAITTNVPSTAPTTTTDADIFSTTKASYVKTKKPAVIKIQEVKTKSHEHVKDELAIPDKKSANRVISDFSHSKLLLANEEPRVNEVPNSFAAELSSQATESGARTSESLVSGAHPGMLILLGAAIGAAAALTIVLSRRATVKRRDRQYQRHENIEVHALTPTTELW